MTQNLYYSVEVCARHEGKVFVKKEFHFCFIRSSQERIAGMRAKIGERFVPYPDIAPTLVYELVTFLHYGQKSTNEEFNKIE